ncbi:MAG: RNA-binding protein [Devosia sp.]
MIRFVLSPDGVVVPDIQRKLPGRGAWVEADHGSVAEAVRRGVFARAFKAPAKATESLADDVAALLRRAALQRLSMCAKAGLLVAGFQKVAETLASGQAAAYVAAADGAEDGRRKVEALAKKATNLHNDRRMVDVFSAVELENALGRDRVVHVALLRGRPTEIFLADAARLCAYLMGDTQTAMNHKLKPNEHSFAGSLAV